MVFLLEITRFPFWLLPAGGTQKPKPKLKKALERKKKRKKKALGVSVPHSHDRAVQAFEPVINVDTNNEALRPQGDRAARLCSRDARAGDNRRQEVSIKVCHRIFYEMEK